MLIIKILKKKNTGFTLVELIIVITILAILTTISFVSFSGYTNKGNDTKKITNLQTIEKGLDLLSIQTGKYPNPDKQYGTGILEGVNLNYVGYVGEDISKIIKLNQAPIDNVTNTNYVYGVSSDFKQYQVGVELEENKEVKIEGNYKYPLKIGDKLYSIPSLIFLGNTITNTGFILEGGENIISEKDKNKQTITSMLEKKTGVGGLSLTGIIIPNIKVSEYKKEVGIPIELVGLGIKDKDYLGEILYGDKYYSQDKSVDNKCPEGYILVPGDSTNTFTYSDGSPTKDFCVMKYEAKNVGGLAKSTPNELPRTGKTQPEVIDLCRALNKGDGTNKYHLITNNEWMTIARNIEKIYLNWSGNSIGSGFIYSGHTDNTPNVKLISSINDNEGYIQTGNSNSSGKNQKRTLFLSNGEIIWDLSGNVNEHVNGTNSISSINGIINDGNSCKLQSSQWKSYFGLNMCDFTNVSPNFFSKLNYGPIGNYSDNIGIGNIFGSTNSSRVMVRGGNYSSSINSGIYNLLLDRSSFNSNSDNLGFRCTYKLK